MHQGKTLILAAGFGLASTLAVSTAVAEDNDQWQVDNPPGPSDSVQLDVTD